MGRAAVKQPLPSIPEEPSPVSSPGIELNELMLKYFNEPEDHFAKPEESSAVRPPPSSTPSGPADGQTDVEQPLPSVPKEPSPVSSPGLELDQLMLKHFSDPEDHFAKPGELSAARPSSSSQPSGPADGWTNVRQPLPSIPKEPSPASSPDHASPSPDDELNELWLEFFGHPESHFFAKPEESSAARPSSSSPPSKPAEGSMDVEQPLPSIPEEPSPVPSSDRAPPNPGSLTESGYELMKGDAPPGAPGPASSTMSSAGHELMGAHALPNPGPSTESDSEMMDVPPSSPVPSTNPDRQSMDADSPSGKRRKMENGLWVN